MGYAFTCDLCSEVIDDGDSRVVVVAARYDSDGEPVLASDLPPGGPEITGMVPVEAQRTLYHVTCWVELLAAGGA